MSGRYGLSRRAALSLFLEDGRVAIDIEPWSAIGSRTMARPAEPALRPIGNGKKNWLFAGADSGSEPLARAMTRIETAKRNGLDPQAYLADILARINDHKINRLGELLPWTWAPVPKALSEAARWQPSPMSAPSTTSPRCRATPPSFSKPSSITTRT